MTAKFVLFSGHNLRRKTCERYLNCRKSYAATPRSTCDSHGHSNCLGRRKAQSARASFCVLQKNWQRPSPQAYPDNSRKTTREASMEALYTYNAKLGGATMFCAILSARASWCVLQDAGRGLPQANPDDCRKPLAMLQWKRCTVATQNLAVRQCSAIPA